jgi:threonine aldolase
VAAAIKPDDPHFAKTRLICLENTQAGKVLPLEYLQRARDFARSRGLALHLDGARVFNAAVKQGVDVREIARPFDTVSVCLSKGLGAPVGSVLCGPKALIERARRWRKVLGGGMRQAGVLAAACLYALEQNVERLAEDHENARFLADGLSQIDGIEVDRAAVQTNMVFARFPAHQLDRLRAFLGQQGVLIASGSPVRLVTHLDVTNQDVRVVLRAIKQFFAGGQQQPATLH